MITRLTAALGKSSGNDEAFRAVTPRVFLLSRCVEARYWQTAINARVTLRDCFNKKSTLNTMAIRTSRLTYIDARRPYGVAGRSTLHCSSRTARAAPARGAHDLIEADRAIHGTNHEPHIHRRSRHRRRDIRHTLLLGRNGAERNQQ